MQANLVDRQFNKHNRMSEDSAEDETDAKMRPKSVASL